MGRNKLRLDVPLRPPLRNNSTKNAAHAGVEVAEKPLSKGVPKGVGQKTDLTQTMEIQQSKPTIESRIFLSKMRAKVAVTIGSKTDRKQRKSGSQKSISSPAATETHPDVFDREKLKNLLNVVSQNATQKQSQSTTGINKCESINSGNGDAVAAQASGTKRKRKANVLKVKIDSNSEQSKRKKLKVSQSSNADTKGVDVIKLKKLLKEVSKRKSNQESSPSAELPMKGSRNVKAQPSLKERMVERLNAARFRYVNEQLYSITGCEAKKFFDNEPDAFQVYHEGFRKQAQKWPSNPLDVIVRDILAKSPSEIVADFGCGDAQLASNIPNTVHSFDLVAVNEQVTECDISKVPLKSKSVDIVVFCLSLMGTNLADYLKEANRVLKDGGELKIAEIESRIPNIKAFNRSLKALGFSLTKQKSDEKMFIFMDFLKKKNCPPNKEVKLALQPCIYKKR